MVVRDRRASGAVHALVAAERGGATGLASAEREIRAPRQHLRTVVLSSASASNDPGHPAHNGGAVRLLGTLLLAPRVSGPAHRARGSGYELGALDGVDRSDAARGISR